jgi:hypothetical protein
VTHGQGTDYVATIPPDTITLFRLIQGARSDSPQFVSNQRLEKIRAWPGRGEDLLMYQGISAYDDPELARSMAARVNDPLIRKGKPPRWTHIAEFHVDGHSGMAFATTRGEGHFTVWGEPEVLASRVAQVMPITA